MDVLRNARPTIAKMEYPPSGEAPRTIGGCPCACDRIAVAARPAGPAVAGGRASWTALLDMVRYERSGLGRSWRAEYGSADDPEQLDWLLSYSPYHAVHPGVAYPAVLFTAFDGDTRVDPSHARELCAALQHATAGEAPILLRTERDVGHSVRAMSRAVELFADTLCFFADQLGQSDLRYRHRP